MRQRVSGFTLPQVPPPALLLLLLLTSRSPVGAQTSLKDGEILLTVFREQSTRTSGSGGGGGPITHWIEGSDPCVGPWEGIECSDGPTKRVTKVLLTSYAMEGTINMAKLPSSLTVFDLSTNRLTGAADMSNIPLVC